MVTQGVGRWFLMVLGPELGFEDWAGIRSGEGGRRLMRGEFAQAREAGKKGNREIVPRKCSLI
jgi:hypothetical protein